ncbi:MAG: ParB N-terminal domain-containing protein [Microcystis sp. M54BS1]|nr:MULTISPECIES: ParB N-terminal domain-containing protein [unclassified Microcystis]MCA2518554.1 ParB N-terminal domain-containing protein [Microcystis sp. M63BS1]MCA2525353.1 ParB N-terminal domain-containing protein [Microcystis sp. M61BS1]MCA2539680.1 ParB N-terminal domain-containing protein [Microcystis sp. M54BS1]MCA2612847.1 ParB N-terminal domain-containing protein [Microcystis sp. M27BS1]MCA2637335.1 ParB N-terminal domain-containing protein [Microcystis sp. M18BS1]
MASRGWGKNKKGILVNSQGKTALEVRLDKYADKLKARKEALAAKKAAKASGGGGGADDGEIDFAELEKARTSQPKKRGYIKPKLQHKSEMTADEKARLNDLFSKEGRAARKGKQEEMQKKQPKRKSGQMTYTDVGTQKNIYPDEISIKNPKKFNEAKLNEAAELIKKAGFNYDPVIVRQKNDDPTQNSYEVIGNAFIYEAAKRAGIEKIHTIVGDGKAERNLKASRDDEPDTLTTGPKYNNKGGYSDIGTIKYTYLDEIDVKPQRVNQKKVAEAAKRFKEEGRNWEPVILKETGPDRYEIIGNAHLYEAAKQAGFDRLWTIIGDNNTKEHKLGGKSKRKR